jgi:hypothetical protein
VVSESRSDLGPSLSLSQQLVWQQSEKFLDFAVFYGLAGIQFSTLVVLEPTRLVYYQAKGSDWYPFKTVVFPHSVPEQRGPTGTISTAVNKVWAPGVQCTGNVDNPAKIECELWKETMLRGPQIGPRIAGHDQRDEGGFLAGRCGKNTVLLVSGNGDWTEPDSVQGYLAANFSDTGVASGSPIKFDGPVTAMRRDDKDSLRAIVHNLKTGNYEGYIVTATCSQ